MMFKALFFDLDGTLSHTDPYHLAAVREALAVEGIALDDALFREQVSGRSNREMSGYFFPHLSEAQHKAFADDKEARFRQLADALQPIAGARRLIDWARGRGLPVALVTNAPRPNVIHTLDAIGLADRFDTQVFGEELPKAKPHPLPYLTAMQRLDIAAADGIAFEDSIPGIQAAKAAGLFTVGIRSSQSAAVLVQAGADLTVDDFDDQALWQALEQR